LSMITNMVAAVGTTHGDVTEQGAHTGPHLADLLGTFLKKI